MDTIVKKTKLSDSEKQGEGINCLLHEARNNVTVQEAEEITFKVIPLKLLYYQTFFETWHNEHSRYERCKNAIKKWGHCACLHVSGLLKWGIFTGFALKIRITFIQSEVLVTQSSILKVKLHLLT